MFSARGHMRARQGQAVERGGLRRRARASPAARCDRCPGGRAGHTGHVITALSGQAATTAAHRRDGIEACIRYLTNNVEYLRYDQALEAGWPIATGVIEGACRHLIADRFDLAGARWGLAGAEAVLKLRALIANGDLDEYWRFRRARQHERDYQNGYSLTA